MVMIKKVTLYKYHGWFNFYEKMIKYQKQNIYKDKSMSGTPQLEIWL